MTKNNGYYAARGQFKVTIFFGTTLGITVCFYPSESILPNSEGVIIALIIIIMMMMMIRDVARNY